MSARAETFFMTSSWGESGREGRGQIAGAPTPRPRRRALAETQGLRRVACVRWTAPITAARRLAPPQSPSVGFRMSAANARRYLTSDEFLTRPAAAGPSELVRGEVRRDAAHLGGRS